MATHGVPHDTWACTLDIHDSALADGTRANYRRAFTRFKEWAAQERVRDTSLSIPEPILCAFAPPFAGYQSGGAARSALAGLHFMHDRQGLAWAGSARLARIVTTVSQMAPDSFVRQPRQPVTLAMVNIAFDGLDPTRGFDHCVGEALLVAFWGQMRLGKILSPTRKYDFAKLPSRKHVHLCHDAGGKLSQETIVAPLNGSHRLLDRGRIDELIQSDIHSIPVLHYNIYIFANVWCAPV